jgi:hypothetical protein
MTSSRLSFKPVEPYVAQTVNIGVDEAQATIWALPNSGNVRMNADQKLTWLCPEPFAVTLRQLGGSKHHPWEVTRATQNATGQWQVSSSPPEFGASEQAPYYKYTVIVRDLSLDPIVIVDK